MEPAAGEGLRRCLVVVEVALHHVLPRITISPIVAPSAGTSCMLRRRRRGARSAGASPTPWRASSAGPLLRRRVRPSPAAARRRSTARRSRSGRRRGRRVTPSLDLRRSWSGSGGAPAVVMVSGRLERRRACSALAIVVSTVGAPLRWVTPSLVDQLPDRVAATARRQTCVPADGGDRPGRAPAVAVEHRQRPQVDGSPG